jgi:ribonuclease VapC
VIVVDTSALIAIIKNEPRAEECNWHMSTEALCLISAGTLAETFIVALRQGLTQDLDVMLSTLELQIVPVTAETAAAVRSTYERWGRGRGTADLNFGDCFAYALAEEQDCPLLFVGNDFGRTDIRSVIGDPGT